MQLKLEEITIKAAKLPEVVVKQDTLEFHAGAYGVREGAAIEEVIRKLPGVEVTADGKIRVEGREVTRILVDGRDFFGADMESTLKNLPASMVHKVQVVDRKSEKDRLTGFENDEREKIINLTIKPDKKRGLFGNVRSGYGTKERYDGAAMANGFYGEDKLSLYLNASNAIQGGSITQSPPPGDGRSLSLGTNLNKQFSEGVNLDGNFRYGETSRHNQRRSYSEQFLPDSSYFSSRSSESRNFGRNFDTDLRFERERDSSLYLSVAPRFGYSRNRTSQLSHEETLSGELHPVNSQAVVRDSRNEQFNYGLSMLLNTQFGKPGRRLTFGVELSGNTGHGEGSNRSENHFFHPDAADSLLLLDQITREESHSLDAGLSASWVEPLFRKSFLQLSYNVNFHQSDNRNDSHEYDGIAYAQLDSLYSRSYRSEGVRQYMALNFRSTLGACSYSFGMGIDPSLSHEESYVGTTTLNLQEQRLLNYSPRANFLWRSGGSNVVLNYNGRSTMPTARQLTDLVELLSPLSEYRGNPHLKGGFTHAVSGQFRTYQRAKQRSLSLGVRGTLEQNSITDYSLYDPSTGRRSSSPINVNGNRSLSANLALSTPLGSRKLQLSSTTQYGYRRRNSFSNGEANQSNSQSFREDMSLNYNRPRLSASIATHFSLNDVRNSLQSRSSRTTFDYGARLTGRFVLPWELSLSTYVDYNGKSGYTGGYNRHVVNWNSELSRSLFKKRAEIGLVWYDMLNQVNNTSRTISLSAVTDSEWNTVGGYVMAKFTYRFNWMRGEE